MEDDAERIDVGGGSLGGARDLLGAGVGGGQHLLDGLRGAGVVEQFGDAEIEQLWLAAGIDQDIGGFEIAMNDEAAMGVGDAVADVEEKLEAAADVELGGVGVDGLSIDVFHDEEGAPGGGVAGVDDVNDGGVLEGSEELTLSEEALAPDGAEAIAAQQLDGDLLLQFAIDALGEVDGAHAAAAEQGQDAVGAEGIAGRGLAAAANGGGDALEGVFEILFGAGYILEERFDLTAHMGIGTCLIEE